MRELGMIKDESEITQFMAACPDSEGKRVAVGILGE